MQKLYTLYQRRVYWFPFTASIFAPTNDILRDPTMLPALSRLANPASALDELNPAPRLLMGPGPINADPRVLKAMSSQLLGQFDPQFRGFMRDTMALYRTFFETNNDWTLVLDGTARSAIEMVMMSAIEPGDKVLVCSFGRFGQLLDEIAQRCGAQVHLHCIWHYQVSG